MKNLLERASRRFARFVTDAVVASPAAWRVLQLLMIPFFDEITRVIRPGGHALFAFSSGAETPIYVPPDRLRAELEHRGFTDIVYFPRGRGTVLVARKR